jgi:tetratricopeptide (TPR) repeat protein
MVNPSSPAGLASPAQDGPPPSGRKKTRWVAAVVLVLLAGGALAYPLYTWWLAEGDTDAETHWHQAEKAIESGDFALAQTHLAACLESWPLNAEAHFLLARTCRRADDAGGWLSHLQKAAALQWDPKEVAFERQLMQAQSGDVWNVEAALESDLDPASEEEVLVLEALVKGYLEVHNFPQVLAKTSYWLKNHPRDWQARLYRGRAYYLARTPTAAIAEYRQVLAARPGQPKALLWLAAALAVDGNYRQALENFQAYLQNDPDHAGALIGVAECQFSLGRPAQARTALEKVLAHRQPPAAAYLIQARLDLAADAPRQALAWLKKAEAMAPYGTDIIQNLILALRQLGNHQEADRYEARLKDLFKQYQRFNEVTKQVMRDPENVALRHETGTLLLGMGRREEAAGWLRSVLLLDPDYRPTHQVLADYYEKAGNVRQAQFHRKKAGEKQPPSKKVWP